jgi:hypothetical protein
MICYHLSEFHAINQVIILWLNSVFLFAWANEQAAEFSRGPCAQIQAKAEAQDGYPILLFFNLL